MSFKKSFFIVDFQSHKIIHLGFVFAQVQPRLMGSMGSLNKLLCDGKVLSDDHIVVMYLRHLSPPKATIGW